jgi:hypothetical protein
MGIQKRNELLKKELKHMVNEYFKNNKKGKKKERRRDKT